MKSVSVREIHSLVGYQAPPTEWFEVDQERIDAFADCTLDHQFIHVDPVQAAATPFGGTIAHGMLTLSLIAHFAKSFTVDVEGTVMGLNYGFDKVRFLSPVKVNSSLRAIAKVTEVTEKAPGQYLMTYSITVEISGESTPALIADWLILVITQG